MPDQLLSGPLGVVIIPDEITISAAHAAAREILPPDSEFILDSGSIPHLTLYHGKFSALPLSVVTAVLAEIRTNLRGVEFQLGPVTGFGGNFIFWDVEQSGPGIAALNSTHLRALKLSEYLDREAAPKAVSEERLSLRPEELENLRTYGHPLVRDQYAPHITLGFHAGVAGSIPAGLVRTQRVTVASVELVRVGYPGRVEAVVHTG